MNPPVSSQPHLFGLLAGLFLAGGLCFSAISLTRTWTHLHESQVVEVTGSAHKNVTSDLAIWRCSFAVEDKTLGGANQLLLDAQARTRRFFADHGETGLQFGAVQISELVDRDKRSDGSTSARRTGFQIVQPMVVTSEAVARLIDLNAASAQLLEQGIVLTSEKLDFIYTKAGEAKVEMMAEATRDARSRATQIAAQGDRRIHDLRSARMGVVQINPVYSSSASWDGNNDTSSVEKTITATVNATFALE